MTKVIRGLGALVVLLCTQLAIADVAAGYQWLSQQQQSDGAIFSSNEQALKYQASHEALKASALFDNLALTSFFQASTINDTEFLARHLQVVDDATQKQVLLNKILTRQNQDGGFGHIPAYGSTNYDSYWALLAIVDSSTVALSGSKVLSYLMTNQNVDGGWSYPESFSSIYLTARVTELLVQLRLQYPTVQDTLNKATGYLLANASLDASIPQRALVLKALSIANASLDVTSGLAQNLLDAQALDGSWEQSVYSTALALQALKAFDRSVMAAGSENGIASVSGKVILAGSSQPVSGVTVAFVNNSNKITTTDVYGDYSLIKLPLGTYTLLYSKPGYYSQTKTVSLVSGDPLKLDNVALQVATSEAVFAGHIYDDQTGGNIDNATLTLSGAGNYTVTTGSNGAFSIAGLPGGNYQLTLQATDYRPLTM